MALLLPYPGSLDGSELPEGIFWAGAINPSNIVRDSVDDALRSEGPGVPESKSGDDAGRPAPTAIIDHTGVRGMAAADLSDFVVRDIPLALQVSVPVQCSDGVNGLSYKYLHVGSYRPATRPRLRYTLS